VLSHSGHSTLRCSAQQSVAQCLRSGSDSHTITAHDYDSSLHFKSYVFRTRLCFQSTSMQTACVLQSTSHSFPFPWGPRGSQAVRHTPDRETGSPTCSKIPSNIKNVPEIQKCSAEKLALLISGSAVQDGSRAPTVSSLLS